MCIVLLAACRSSAADPGAGGKDLVDTPKQTATNSAARSSPGLAGAASSVPRQRLLIETDAGGDPDDEQSLVRFLLYANEWDVEGIIANRPRSRERENLNPERTGLGVARRLLSAYGQCWTNLSQHDERFPPVQQLWTRTVAGYDDSDDGVNLILATVDSVDPRPLWYSDWGSDRGAATNNLKRALDRVLRERGLKGYEKFKSRLRLSSAPNFGEHLAIIEPPFALWVNTFEPEIQGKRWYHRFSALTARAGGFDLVRDVLTGHGPLGACYPTNTTHWQKEGDTMSFLYLVPTGMNDPEQPGWGSWAGRYGLNTTYSGRNYFWANQTDHWQGSTNRDNTLARWGAALQNDFRARLDWCVKPLGQANHPPVVKLLGSTHRSISAGQRVELEASGSSDPDSDELSYTWELYRETGTYLGELTIENAHTAHASVVAPAVQSPCTAHLILTVTDNGAPPLSRYQRVVLELEPR